MPGRAKTRTVIHSTNLTRLKTYSGNTKLRSASAWLHSTRWFMWKTKINICKKTKFLRAPGCGTFLARNCVSDSMKAATVRDGLPILLWPRSYGAVFHHGINGEKQYSS